MVQLQPLETTSSPPQSMCSSSVDDEQPLLEGVKAQSSQVLSCSECQVFLQHMKSSHNDAYCQMLTRNGQIPPAACEQATKQEDANKPRSYSQQQFPKTSTQPEGKTHHQLTYTTGEKILTCKQCDKSFNRLSNLNKHQRIHTGQKPFHCQQCDKRFSRCDHLKRHRSVHTGEKPFPCKQCHKSFSDVGNLKKHQPIHTGERPFHCKQCGKSFNSLGNLKKHQRLHTGEKPHHCKLCDKRFNVLGHLRRHQRIHTGEKPFQCQRCDKRFNDSSNLKTHQRVHTREKNLSLLTV